MKAMVYVDPPGLEGVALRRWVGAAADFMSTLPAKQPKGTAAAARQHAKP